MDDNTWKSLKSDERRSIGEILMIGDVLTLSHKGETLDFIVVGYYFEQLEVVEKTQLNKYIDRQVAYIRNNLDETLRTDDWNRYERGRQDAVEMKTLLEKIGYKGELND